MNISEAVGLGFTLVGNGRYLRTLEHDSLVLDTEKNTFFWNSKGFGGNVYTFLTKVLGTPKEVARMYATPEVKRQPLDKNLRQDLHLLFWENGKKFREFWYQRGYTDEVIDLYLLGHFSGNYTLPFIMQGVLKAIILRGDNKYISEVSGSQKALFGLDNLQSSDIILVESPLDVPLLRVFGYDAVSYTYGANAWDNSWNGLLHKYNVTIIPDNDSAGFGSIKRIKLNANVSTWPKNTPKGFDVGKLYLNNPENFRKNIDYLLDTSIPIELWHAEGV